MRKIFTSLCALLMAGTMSVSAQGYTLRVLTFEDADLGASFSGQAGVDNYVSTWEDMIATDQGSDAMLYGDNYGMESEQFYWWHDGGNTELFSQLNFAYGAYAYWSGGHAISHYWSSDIVTYGDYMSQLTVYRPGSDAMNTAGGGHNGSDNFAVHFGYNDGSEYSTDGRVTLEFADGEARVIDHMYVCPTTYALNCFLNGNELTSNLSADDYVKLIAEGYANDSKVGECEFVMANGDDIVMDWTKWDLYSLGAVDKVVLNIVGTNDNGYGFSQPAYFAYDDVAVRFPSAEPDPEPEPTSYTRSGLTAGKFGTICLQYAVNEGDYTGAVFYKVVERNAAYVTLEEVTSLEAGQAYIFEATGTEINCTYSGDKVTTPATATVNNVLQGVFELTTIPSGKWFLNNNQLWCSTGTQTVGANRAYLTELTPAAKAPVPGRRRLNMPIQANAPTAVENVQSDNVQCTKVMRNGKLYLMYKGTMYDVQGKVIEK